ncbi:hypothetical protein Q8A67_021628 [Cirrhinus molitorella]|uniref:Uncharacterized protein n=1 Tax=Cirrhinus molitorella TaxID=172907 RepID=A0AA88PB35_9TELE|nr:hypothetical protein Q8A67_021628 [Cirrhinus molitorella]
MEAFKLPSIPGSSHAKELRPHPPPQKKVKSVSAHQNIISVSENTKNSGKMEAVKLPSISPPSHAKGLRPHPPPQKKVNGSRLSAEEQFQLFGLRSREDRVGEEVRAFIKEGRQGRSSTQGEISLLPYWKRGKSFESISDYKARIIGSARKNIDTADLREAFQTENQNIFREERNMAQKELAAKQARADAEAEVHDSNRTSMKNKQKAQDSLVRNLRLDDQRKALLRKTYDVEDIIEVEKLRLSEEQAEREKRNRKPSPEEVEILLSDYENGMILTEDEGKILTLINKENDKLKHYVDRIGEELQNRDLQRKQEEERLKLVKVEVEMIRSKDGSRRMKKIEQLCEELVTLQDIYGVLGYSSAYPMMILQQLEDCILESLDFIEESSETVHKLQKQICQQCEIREQEQKRMRFKALLEERRQKRLARKLRPPVKPTGKKLMPRSQPLRSIKKREEPVQANNGKQIMLTTC